MVEKTTHYRSYQPDRSYDPGIDAYDENLTSQHIPPYRFGQSAKTYSNRNHSVPLFLSDSDGEPDPSEYQHIMPVRKHRVALVPLSILAGALAIAAVALVLTGLSSDIMRDIVVSAKASITAALPASSAATKPDSAQLTARYILKDPARLPEPVKQPLINQINQTAGVRSATTVALVPTRTEIASANQNALQGRIPAASAPIATPAARNLDPAERATLLNRAKGLLAAGDIPSARLLLERAADAQEPGAALMLARTYDPDVLGPQDARNIIPDPARARAWYQKAAELGSADAQRRLSQMQN
jgi:hypothetical protein